MHASVAKHVGGVRSTRDYIVCLAARIDSRPHKFHNKNRYELGRSAAAACKHAAIHDSSHFDFSLCVDQLLMIRELEEMMIVHYFASSTQYMHM